MFNRTPFPTEEIKMHANDLMHQYCRLYFALFLFQSMCSARSNSHSLTDTYTHNAPNVFCEKNLVIHFIQNSTPSQIVFTQGERLQMYSLCWVISVTFEWRMSFEVELIHLQEQLVRNAW